MSMDFLPKSGTIYSISFPRMLQQRQAFASPSTKSESLHNIDSTSTESTVTLSSQSDIVPWTRSHWVQPLVELRIERPGMNCIGFLFLEFSTACQLCNFLQSMFLWFPPHLASSVLHLQLLVDLWKLRSRQRTGWKASSPQCRLNLTTPNTHFITLSFHVPSYLLKLFASLAS